MQLQFGCVDREGETIRELQSSRLTSNERRKDTVWVHLTVHMLMDTAVRPQLASVACGQ